MAEPIQPTPETAETVPLERVEPGPTPAGSDASRSDGAAVQVGIETAPPKKRRRWLGWVIAAGVLVVLLVVGFLVGDGYARQYAKDYVRDQIIQVLALPKDTPVDVELGSGSVILQALAGSISEVTVGIDTLTVGPITGSARLAATGVPLDGTKPLNTLGIVVTIPEKEVRKLAGNLSGLELKSIDVGDGVIAIGTEVNILGFLIIPIGIDLAPSAVDGGISFDPQVIRVGKDEISVADLRASPEFSAIAGDLLRSQDFCVASSLPRALTITDVAVSGSSLVVTLSGDGAVLGGEEMSTMGECSKK